MAARNAAAPVIIKRKKVVAGDGHHGGAWKVAYADFVTAMMAFFMLMWLLNATTEQQRKGLADYFNPSIPIARISGGGQGAFGGDNVLSENTLAQNGQGASAARPSTERQASGAEATQDMTAFQQMASEIEAALTGASGALTDRQNLLRHIDVKLTDEGLVVEFFDQPDAALFDAETAQPTPLMRELLGVVTRVFAIVTNPVAIESHTRTYPEVLRHDPSWDLTTARAQAVRQHLAQTGFPPARIERVTGYADRRPADPNPMAPRNNRLELILLRSAPKPL
ncbi:flagellar motor protein MotB [Paracoccus sp. p4-l81]|uniref:flagellar motor protein MotB n=1 Tax=unclassified Paracoccus (in: a-proteobacteria) TaxID=2688777 RepID=UPI0035B9B6D4